MPFYMQRLNFDAKPREPIPCKKLTSEKFVHEIKEAEMMTMLQRASDLGSRITVERCVEEAVGVIKQIENSISPYFHWVLITTLFHCFP